MTIPLRDENPSSTFPKITVAIIVVNVLVFLYELMLGPQLRDFMFQWGFVPQRLTLALRFGDEPFVQAGLPIVTSMFLHGGWLHLLGNLWYLWIFGDNVEDRLGSVRYVFFYLTGGIVAAVGQYLAGPASAVPTVGASGAIAAVLGAYAQAYPRARVTTVIPFFPFIRIVQLPALVVLGLWFVLQAFSGAMSLGFSARGGVAWFAHVGGFLFGVVAMWALGRGRRPQARVDVR